MKALGGARPPPRESVSGRAATAASSSTTSPASDFLPREGDLEVALAPLRSVGQEAAYNVTVRVNGGGPTGQRDAIQLGLARALLKVEPEWRNVLRQGEFLSRDPRIKERKKPGLKRARKAPTYTKR